MLPFIALLIMNRNRCLISVCFGLMFAIVGCGDPKTASKENFGKVIAASIEKNPVGWVGLTMSTERPCLIYLGSEFPQVVQQSNVPKMPGFESMLRSQPSLPHFDALVAQGILTSQTISDQQTLGTRLIKKQYDLTDQGRQKILRSPGSNLLYLPYCKVRFKGVTSYVEPAESGGAKRSLVKYTYTTNDIAAWVKEPANQALFPEVTADVQQADQAIAAQMSLILTSEGWANGAEVGL
jgi:hypothetical protein